MDDSAIVVATRKLLEAAHRNEVQSMLWTGGNTSCSVVPDPPPPQGGSYVVPGFWRLGGLPLRNPSSVIDLLLAQLPNGFNPGLIAQAILYIKSTAVVRNISIGEFPADCQTD
ncbi:hypothetical protein BDW71DRAFT_207702 [Aspergillus fruticulosus]